MFRVKEKAILETYGIISVLCNTVNLMENFTLCISTSAPLYIQNTFLCLNLERGADLGRFRVVLVVASIDSSLVCADRKCL